MLKINPEKEYLIAVSGGPDSIFLLTEINKLHPKKLIICHVNYHFRSDSDFDQQIVEDFCSTYNLICEIKNIDPTFYQDFKGNFESWARQERYLFFQAISEKYQIFNLLIAHNQNDLIETYILQKQRRSLVNYFGLKPISQYQKLTVIRPLLKYKKSEIIQTLDQNQVPYAWDSTNDDLKYERNKIRKHLKETDFDHYLRVIKEENQTLEIFNNQVQFYLKNNLNENKLLLTQQLKGWDLNLIQRLLYQFFLILNHEELMQNRKKQLLLEMSKRLKFSSKNFWKVSISNFVLMKDFDHLIWLPAKNLIFKTFIIESQKDWNKVQEFSNGADLVKIMEKNPQSYPYILTNNFLDYKGRTFYQKKPMNRYLINHKVSYEKRYLRGVIYEKGKKIILNKID